jgi:hypothetical protein
MAGRAEARPLHLTLTDLKIGHYMHGTTFLALRLPVARLARLVLPVRELVALPLVRARLVRLRVLPGGEHGCRRRFLRRASARCCGRA